MKRPRRLIRRIIRPALRTASLVWLWRNRHHLPGAARFLREAPARVRAGGRSDVQTEARLRARLARDPRTRDREVDVRVTDGVAILPAEQPISIVAADIAREVRGVEAVDLTSTPVMASATVVLPQKAG